MSNKFGFLFSLLAVCLFFSPALAFGAGDVPKDNTWKGLVWRHGDIEQLLTALPVYFGNWLRDYSQVLDITCLSQAHESVLRGIVSVLAFMEFKLATEEWDVTKERLGVYKHVEHIDNPKGYATDLPGIDASRVDHRLRGPVQEEELKVDPRTGMKNYISNSGQGWDTSADYIRRELTSCIRLGRERKLNDAFIHLGAALHTLEDFAAHSNFTELCLHELGEEAIFPFVGDACKIEIPGSSRYVAPITTGTFGALDILQSFLGEADDKMAILNEGESGAGGDLSTLENKLTPGGMVFNEIFTVIKNTAGLLARVPGMSSVSSINADLSQLATVAKDAEENPAKYRPNDDSAPMPDLWETIQPAFKLHDDVQKWLMENEDLLEIPYLSKAIDKIGVYLDALVYKFIAIILEPSVQEVRNAVKAAKDAAIEQGAEIPNVFASGSDSSDPSHSDIAKDHYTNLLNQPAGLVATVTTNWTVQKVVHCWDDPGIDCDSTISDILTALYHPAFVSDKNNLQQYMFSAVEQWWNLHTEAQKQTLRQKLSKAETQNHGDNHDHTLNRANFDGLETLQHAFKFPGSQPELRVKPESGLGSEIVDIVSTVSEGLYDAREAIKNGTMEVVDVLGDGVEELGRGAEFVWNVAGDAANDVGNGFVDAGNGIAEFTVGVAEGIGNGANDIAEGVSDFAGNAWDGFKSIW